MGQFLKTSTSNRFRSVFLRGGTLGLEKAFKFENGELQLEDFIVLLPPLELRTQLYGYYLFELKQLISTVRLNIKKVLFDTVISCYPVARVLVKHLLSGGC